MILFSIHLVFEYVDAIIILKTKDGEKPDEMPPITGRYCGMRLSCVDIDTLSERAIREQENTPIYANNFRIHFVTNGMDGTSNMNRGFSLDFLQVPCGQIVA